MIIILSIWTVINIALAIILLRTYHNKYKEIEENNNIKLQNQFNQKKEQLNRDYELRAAALDKEYQIQLSELRALNTVFDERQSRATELEQSYQDALAHQKEKMELELQLFRKQRSDKDALDHAAAVQQLKQEYAEIEQRLISEVADLSAQCDDVKQELLDYQTRQAAINNEIARRREIEQQQDFYRILLSDSAKQDIHYLLSIIDNLRNPTLVYKLIWSEYIQKPFNAMLKNVLGGKECKSVIYKITNTTTGEIYIGKTKADVSKRWTEHIKTSLGIGTVARSKVHDALYNHWDNFTFEVIESSIDESALSEREKYYINFYQSNIYGYNMNSGG